MKHCPKCQQSVQESSLNFCRADGSVLVKDSLTDAATLLSNVKGSRNTTKPLAEPASSLAVLPFRNLTADTVDDYFCVGLAEELVHALSRIENLRVAAPNSAFALQEKDLDAIGRTLNVEAVLEGSIRRSQSKMRITMQLVSTKTGYHLWSERYDRDVNATFDLSADIVFAVLKALAVRLGGRERVAVRKRYTENPTAHQLYLRGRFHAGRLATVYFTLGEVDRGFEWFEKAFDEYDENLSFMAADPVLDSQRSDPRFIDLLDRAGLEQSFARTHFVVPVSGDCRAATRL
jgi:TolB-like protein